MTVGIDIEQCDNLPAVDQIGASAFYKDHFTSAEIAYCQRQPNPRESFCGLWSAKEAVMKCGGEFLKARAVDLEIGHDADGRPFLTVVKDGKPMVRTDCAISISHSHGVAVAVCVLGRGTVNDGDTRRELPETPVKWQGDWVGWLALGLGAVSLLVWLVTVCRR